MWKPSCALRAGLAGLAGLAALGGPGRPAHASDECFNVRAEMTPTDSLQIVVWLENSAGTYIDTLYMTAKTGFYGIGNRPGRMDFNSGPVPDPAAGIDDMWPYGRRTGVFPVWAHRHGMTWPEVVFQDGFEDDLSHSQNKCSPEPPLPFCRPVAETSDVMCGGNTDPIIWDTGTCATVAYTDKGTLHPTRTSLYPPRADITRQGVDSTSVTMYADLNPFDAITRATPRGGEPLQVTWTVPPALPAGPYVLWAEVSKAFDHNATYSEVAYPGPTVNYGACGRPYRGQPSVVYRVPFTISPTYDVETTLDYAGYGDVNGDTGTLHSPDATITTDTPGSGALRLQLVSDQGTMFRLRVTAAKIPDLAPPGTPSELAPRTVASTTARLDFVEPGDDGAVGAVTRYEVRIMANGVITEDNFADAAPVLAEVSPVEPGRLATIALTGLLPETPYSVAVRAYDDCYKQSPLVVTRFTTGEREVGSVDACFVATAAYGSLMANDVSMLRAFRDRTLARSILGELAIETYYTFGPAMAGVIGESDVLREAARVMLRPMVDRLRTPCGSAARPGNAGPCDRLRTPCGSAARPGNAGPCDWLRELAD